MKPDYQTTTEGVRAQPRTGLVTLVFTDIVGSTQLKQTLGDREAVGRIQRHHALVRDLVRPFPDAQEVSTAGDSFFLLFARPSDAVRFALQLQHRLREQGWGDPHAVRDRIGIHLGEVVVEAGEGKPRDLYGLHVDTAARVMSLAQAGQILLTRSAFDSARQSLKGEEIEGLGELSWLNHGPYLLKGLDEPVEICEVREAGQAVLSPPTSSEKAERVTVEGEPVLGWRPAVEQMVPNTKWFLEEKLGEGGFGEVWLGRHQTMKERRVFKFCFRGDRVRSLKREMTLFRLIRERIGDHPNIVSLREVYFDEPPFYVEMDYVAGQDLRTWCEAQGGVERVPLEARLEIVAQVADALQAAHDAGVIHRDVKPGNILVSGEWPVASGEQGPATRASTDSSLVTGHSSLLVKLTDFGIGQVVSQEYLSGITKAGFTQTLLGSESSSQTGTQLYLAPELLAGKPASTRSDIYSLGVVLYQLLVGDFTQPVAVDWAKQVADPLLREDLAHCFAGNPEERFAGAAQLAKDLRAHDQRRAEQVRRQAEEAERERLRRQAIHRRRIAWASTAAAGVLVLLALALAYGMNRASRERDRQRLYAYASDMRAADVAVRENNLGQARNLLLRHLPEAGQADLRGIEWRYLWHRCQGNQAATFRHDSKVVCADISPDGQWIAGQCGGLTWIWDVVTQKPLRKLEAAPPSSVQQYVAFCPTGQLLAAQGPAGMTIWDTSSWERIRTLPCTNAAVAFSGDGTALATFGREGLLQVWKTATWEQRASPGELKVHSNPDEPAEHALALNYDGSLLAACQWDYSIEYRAESTDEITLWSLAMRRPLMRLTAIRQPRSMAFSNDGRWLAVGSLSGRVYLWALTDRKLVLDYPAHKHRVFGLAFSPDSQVLASAGNDQVIHLWQAGTGNRLATLNGHLSDVWSVRFSTDGRWLVSASKDGTARLWRASATQTGDHSFAVPEGHLIGDLAPDASRLNTVNPAEWTLEEWDTAGGKLLSKVRITGTNDFYTLAGVPVARRVAIWNWSAARGLSSLVAGTGGWGLTAGTADGWVYAWSRQNGSMVYSNKIAEGAVIGGLWSRDRQRFSALELGPKGANVVWNVAEKRREATLRDYQPKFAGSAWFSWDGRLYGYPSTNGSYVVWDIGADRAQCVLQGYTGAPKSVAFSRDGRFLAIGTDDAMARIWSLPSGHPVSPPLIGHLSGIEKLIFSPDGRTLLTYGGENRCHLWNVATGQQVVSDLPLNDLLCRGGWLQVLSEDGNVIVEPDGENKLRFVRLPPLAEIDGQEKGRSPER